MLGLAICEKSRDRRDPTLLSRSSDRVEDDPHVRANLWVVARLAVQRGQHGCSFLLSVVSEQPPWRFRQAQHEDDDDKGKYALEGDGKPPDHVVRSIQTAVVDPVSDKRSDSDVAALDTDELSSVVGFATFCLVGWHSRCVDSVADLRPGQQKQVCAGYNARTPVMHRPMIN